MNVAMMTKPVPMTKYPPGTKSFMTRYENTEDTIIEIEVAKPLRILSAYLTVMATTNPPKAWKKIRFKVFLINRVHA